MKKYLPLFILFAFASCKTAFVTSYSFPQEIMAPHGFYTIHLESKSFEHYSPVTASTSDTEWVDGQWVNYSDEEVVGCVLNSDERSIFDFLLQKAMNQNSTNTSAGDIVVHRLQHSSKPDSAPALSLLTLFIPNIIGLPIRSNKVEDAYLFEVYNPDGVLKYRGIHAGIGKAKCGFYYGYKNSDQKASYDAAYAAISEFVEAFDQEN